MARWCLTATITSGAGAMQWQRCSRAVAALGVGGEGGAGEQGRAMARPGGARSRAIVRSGGARSRAMVRSGGAGSRVTAYESRTLVA
jgi:hypothetical protein